MTDTTPETNDTPTSAPTPAPVKSGGRGALALAFVAGLAAPSLLAVGFVAGAAWSGGDVAIDTPKPAPSASATTEPSPAPTTDPSTPPAASEPSAGAAADFPLPVGVDTASAPYVTGDPSAPVSVAIVEDYTCPFCAMFHKDYMPLLLEAAGEGAIQVKQYVVSFFGPGAVDAANAAACAADQGMFAQYSDLLYAGQKPEHAGMSEKELNALAKKAGVGDLDTFASCVKDKTYAEYAQAVTDAAGAAGVPGTPTVFVDGVMMDPTAITPEWIAGLSK